MKAKLARLRSHQFRAGGPLATVELARHRTGDELIPSKPEVVVTAAAAGGIFASVRQEPFAGEACVGGALVDGEQLDPTFECCDMRPQRRESGGWVIWRSDVQAREKGLKQSAANASRGASKVAQYSGHHGPKDT